MMSALYLCEWIRENPEGEVCCTVHVLWFPVKPSNAPLAQFFWDAGIHSDAEGKETRLE